MRRFLAVAVLGASLALTAGSAFASENIDYNYYHSFQQTQTVAGDNLAGSAESVIAGDTAPKSVYGDMRNENFEN